MTTAQDVIAEWLHQQYGDCFEHEHAGELIAALQGAPELARLELAALLNPRRPIETAPQSEEMDELKFDNDGYPCHVPEPTVVIPRAQLEALIAAASEATIAWACCASIHRVYAKRKDPFYTTRQADFVKHEETARAALRAAGHLPAPPSEDK